MTKYFQNTFGFGDEGICSGQLFQFVGPSNYTMLWIVEEKNYKESGVLLLNEPYIFIDICEMAFPAYINIVKNNKLYVIRSVILRGSKKL